MYPPNTRNTRKEIHAVREAKPRIHRRQRRKRRCRPLLRSLSFLLFETSGPSRRTTKLPDRHDLTYENQKLQGKSPGANGGSVQRLVRHSAHSISKSPAHSVRNCRDGRPCDRARKCTHEIRETHEKKSAPQSRPPRSKQ